MREFDYTGKLSEGFRRFKIGTYPHFACGFTNEAGDIVVSPIYSSAKDFHNGYAAVQMGNWSSGKWGFINYSGNLVIACRFDQVRKFSDGYCKVVFQGKWYFINEAGEIVISLHRYDGGTGFHGGYAFVWKNKGYNYREAIGIIDKEGFEVLPCTTLFSEKRCLITCSRIGTIIAQYQSGACLSCCCPRFT